MAPGLSRLLPNLRRCLNSGGLTGLSSAASLTMTLTTVPNALCSVSSIETNSMLRI